MMQLLCFFFGRGICNFSNLSVRGHYIQHFRTLLHWEFPPPKHFPVSLHKGEGTGKLWGLYSGCVIQQLLLQQAAGQVNTINDIKFNFIDCYTTCFNNYRLSVWGLSATYALSLSSRLINPNHDLAWGVVYLLMPITPQAWRAPALPVFRLSSSPPFPKSSTFAWTWKVRHQLINNLIEA